MSTMDNILCSYCDVHLRDDEALKAHFKKQHLINLTKPPCGIFICKTNNCDRKFKQSRNFFQHVRSYHCVEKKYDSVAEPLEKKKKNVGSIPNQL